MAFEFLYKFLFSARSSAVVRIIARLSMVGIFVSVSSLILVLSVMTALNKNIEERFLSVEPHLHVQVLDVANSSTLDVHPVTLRLKDELKLRVQAVETSDVILRSADGHFKGALAKGMAEDDLIQRLSAMSEKGSLISKEDLNLKENDILIGSDLAISLGVFEGDSMLIVPPESLLQSREEIPDLERVRVRKIFSSQISDVDSQLIYYVAGKSLLKLQSSPSLQRTVEVWTKDPHDLSPVISSLQSFQNLRIESWKERNSALFTALRIEKLAIGFFLTMASLLALFSLISVVVLLISQKKKEMGLLMALGMSRTDVQFLFWKIALILSVMGLGSGALLGSGLSFYIEKNPLKDILPSDVYYDAQIPADFQPAFVVLVLAIGLAVSAYASRIVTRQILKIEPSRVLKVKAD